MSMMTYLAINTPLPMGDFISVPDAVYDNYDAFKLSRDYMERQHDELHIIISGRKRTACVHFYKAEPRQISICEFDHDAPPSRILPDVGEVEVPLEALRKCVLDQEVRVQFSLKLIYCLDVNMDYSEAALRDFLCAYLKPGEKAEVYNCWAMTENEERDRTWDQTVDLQDFIDHGDIAEPTSEYAEQTEKRFITYLAPTAGSVKLNYVQPTEAIIIYDGEQSKE